VSDRCRDGVCTADSTILSWLWLFMCERFGLGFYLNGGRGLKVFPRMMKWLIVDWRVAIMDVVVVIEYGITWMGYLEWLELMWIGWFGLMWIGIDREQGLVTIRFARLMEGMKQSKRRI
jgi:hypothetical protein